MGSCYGWLLWVAYRMVADFLLLWVVAMGGCYGWLLWVVAMGGVPDGGRLLVDLVRVARQPDPLHGDAVRVDRHQRARAD